MVVAGWGGCCCGEEKENRYEKYWRHVCTMLGMFGRWKGEGNGDGGVCILVEDIVEEVLETTTS